MTKIETLLQKTGLEPSFHNGFDIRSVALRIHRVTQNVLDDIDHPEEVAARAEYWRDTHEEEWR